MSEPIKLGRIVLYARITELGDGTRAFLVLKYSLPGRKCRVPFNQEAGNESNLFVRPADPEVRFPPVEGSDPNGECDAEAPFLKYDFKEGQIPWVVVDDQNQPLWKLYGFLSQILAVTITPK